MQGCIQDMTDWRRLAHQMSKQGPTTHMSSAQGHCNFLQPEIVIYIHYTQKVDIKYPEYPELFVYCIYGRCMCHSIYPLLKKVKDIWDI